MLETILTSVGRPRTPVGDETGEDRSRLLAYLLLVGPAAGLVGYHAYLVLSGRAGEIARILAWVASGTLAVAAAYAVWWLRSRDASRTAANRAGAWFLAVALAFAGAAGGALFLQRELGGALVDPGYTVAAVASGGATVGVLVGLHEARARRSIEDERRTREEAERRNRQLAVLNRILRHELRNELNLVQGNAEIVMDTTAGDKPRLREIHRVAEELMELSERAREVQTLLSTPPTREETTTVDVAERTREHVERVSREFPDATVRASIPASAPAECHELVGDAVGEVLVNAAEHNDAPDPTVEVEVSTVEDGDRVEVVVTDDGPGIPDHEISVLEDAHDPGLRGSQGLGLQLAAGAVGASGGMLAFEGGNPRGTTVRISLDAA